MQVVTTLTGYLAKYPLKSQVFCKTTKQPEGDFLFKALCGKQEVVLGEGHHGLGARGKFKPEMHHHSVLGKAGGCGHSGVLILQL